MRKRICAAAVALLLFLGACTQAPPPPPGKTIVKATTGRSSAVSVSEEETPSPDKHQLQMVDHFNASDFLLTAECPETVDNSSMTVRADAALGARAASILTQSVFEPNIAKPTTDPELEARKITLEARKGTAYSRVSLFGFQEDHPVYGEKTLVILENDTGVTQRYLYDVAVFEELDRELRARVGGVSVSLIGDCARLISKYDLAIVKRDKGLWSGEFLQFDDKMLWRFVPGDPAIGNSVVELFNAGNGRSLYSYGISEPVYRMEKYSGPEGSDYRLLTSSRIIYKKSGDPVWQQEWPLPSGLPLFTASAQLTGRYDQRFGKLAYAAEDGVHVADEDGANDRLLMSHQALDTVMTGWQGGSWYFNDPRLMLDGTKLVTSIVGTQRGRERLGFAVSDLESFETTYFTDFGAQDELAVRYLGDRVVAAQQPGRITLLDTQTMETGAMSLEEGDGILAFSNDYNEFIVSERSPVIENKPVITSLYRCTADDLGDRSDMMLVVKGDIFYPVTITENYMIGYCEDNRGIHYTAARYNNERKTPPPASTSSSSQPSEDASSSEAHSSEERSDETIFPNNSSSASSRTSSELYEEEFGELPPDITPDWMRDMLLQSIRNTRGASPDILKPYLGPEEKTELTPYDSMFSSDAEFFDFS